MCVHVHACSHLSLFCCEKWLDLPSTGSRAGAEKNTESFPFFAKPTTQPKHWNMYRTITSVTSESNRDLLLSLLLFIVRNLLIWHRGMPFRVPISWLCQRCLCSGATFVMQDVLEVECSWREWADSGQLLISSCYVWHISIVCCIVKFLPPGFIRCFRLTGESRSVC